MNVIEAKKLYDELPPIGRTISVQRIRKRDKGEDAGWAKKTGTLIYKHFKSYNVEEDLPNMSSIFVLQLANYREAFCLNDIVSDSILVKEVGHADTGREVVQENGDRAEATEEETAESRNIKGPTAKAGKPGRKANSKVRGSWWVRQ